MDARDQDEPSPTLISADEGRVSTRSRSVAHWTREFRDLALLALALFLTIHSVAQAYNVPTGSMEDTILIGDYLWAGKFVYGAPIPFTHLHLPGLRDPRPNDIVVFKFPGDNKTDYVKRCVGVPGDTIEVRSGVLFVNGDEFVDPRHVKHAYRPPELKPSQFRHRRGRDDYGPFVVPQDNYFMMGDNRDNSYDSRSFGPVPRDLIVAKALFLYMSWNPEVHPGPETSPDKPLSYVQRMLHSIRYAPAKVRWSRIGDSLM